MLAVATLPSPVEAKVSQITLSELVKASELIVVATEVKVDEVPAGAGLVREVGPTIRIATVRVEEVWKGEVGAEVRYLASPTWACDISEARPGERVVLFLTRHDPFPCLLIAHSGRGRMPIRDARGKPRATIWTDDVHLPGDLGIAQGPEPRYEFIRSVGLSELKQAVRGGSGTAMRLVATGGLFGLIVVIIVKLRSRQRILKNDARVPGVPGQGEI